MFKVGISFVCFIILMFSSCSNGTKPFAFSPNIVFILTDDQDIELGGMDPLTKINTLLKKEGAEFKNMFVTTPLCCPSRSSILTGLYAHNHGTRNNSISGGCSSTAWQNQSEHTTFVTKLKEQEYVTFYAGKYLNEYGKPEVGGANHIPPGWDQWIGLVGNSKYYDYELSVNGVIEKHGNDTEDYLTNVILNKSLSFLESMSDSKPFFMMLSPPAPHAPFTPEPKYEDLFANETAPRTPSFNLAAGNTKHWLLREPPNPLPDDVIAQIDDNFRNRFRSLKSVDDLVESIYLKLKSKNMLETTYIFFTSDNGFHLGQFSLPWDKRQPYEFDIKVPLLVRGPGIAAGKIIQVPSLNIDLAPTFVEISGLSSTGTMDGLSLLTILYNNEQPAIWRSHFTVEHQGEGHPWAAPGCSRYQSGGVTNCFPDCICQDSLNNTYSCVRQVTTANNTLFCKFSDTQNFQEYYDMNADPHQLNNLTPPGNNSKVIGPELMRMETALNHLKSCYGKQCNVVG